MASSNLSSVKREIEKLKGKMSFYLLCVPTASGKKEYYRCLGCKHEKITKKAFDELNRKVPTRNRYTISDKSPKRGPVTFVDPEQNSSYEFNKITTEKVKKKIESRPAPIVPAVEEKESPEERVERIKKMIDADFS